MIIFRYLCGALVYVTGKSYFYQLMGYLVRSDYLKQIQDGHLDEITDLDSSVIISAELAAIEEVVSYLSQKYMIDKEFSQTSTWSPSVEYYAADRVVFTADAYDEDLTYALNALVEYLGDIYMCTSAVVTPESFDAGKWTLLAPDGQIRYVAYPKPLFDINKPYSINDQVYWNGYIYKSKTDTGRFSQQAMLQYIRYSNVPDFNVIPGSLPNGSSYWEELSEYKIAAGTLPTTANGWVVADNRNQQILTYTIDIALYHMFSRIAPMNIPQIRMDRYYEAREWLKAAGKGTITARLEIIQPEAGNSIRYGGMTRTINHY